MHADELPHYIRALLDPRRYPHPVKEVELVQTHISYLLLAGEFVYKFKKPVNLGFLDFSSASLRAHFCAEELRLNRRLCPEIYLGILGVERCADGYRIGEVRADAVDYGVKMRRLPDDRMMTEVMATGALTEHHLDAVVEKLVPFYRAAERSTPADWYGTVAAISKDVTDNFDMTAPFVGSSILGRSRFSRIMECSNAFLDRQEIFEDRRMAGWVREGHGDLHAANICLTDPVAIFDCIEFSRNLRFTDIAADVGFLAMDLDYHGLTGLSDRFIEQYIIRSGDTTLLSVLDFYKCYRAYVRGKISLLTASDHAIGREEGDAMLRRAARYFALAEHYTRGWCR